MFIKGIL